jgi:hypothetical protein
VSLYRHHLGVFLGIGAIFIPIGIVAALFNTIHLALGDVDINLSLLLGGLPLLAAFVVVNAAVARALRELDAGRRPAAWDSYRAVWTHLRTLVWARLKVLGIVSLLAISVIGIPFAVIRMIRWLFVEQAIMIDEAGSQTALAVSAGVVQGRWWRTLASAVVLGFVGLLTGPIVAVTLLILFQPSADFINVLSSIIFALILPLVFIALTQLYTSLKARANRPD